MSDHAVDRLRDAARNEQTSIELNHLLRLEKSETSELRAQVAALTKENEHLKTVPMKYRRMAFNAQLQDENAALTDALGKARDAITNGERVRNHEGGTQYQPDLAAEALAAIDEALRTNKESNK